MYALMCVCVCVCVCVNVWVRLFVGESMWGVLFQVLHAPPVMCACVCVCVVYVGVYQGRKADLIERIVTGRRVS